MGAAALRRCRVRPSGEGVGMRSGLRKLLVLACVLGIAVPLGQSVALAAPTPVGPVQPGSAPLTGVSFTSAGDIGRAGGLTYTFSGLTSGLLAQFQSLEWGPADANGVQLAMDGAIDAPGETLTFNAGASDLAIGKAVWTGSAQYPIAQPATTLSLLTRFTMTAEDAASAPITGFIATSGYGDGATVPVSGDFSANLLYEVSADGGVTWTPAKDYFDAQQNVPGNQIVSSFTGAFFYTLANVPVASVTPSSFDFGHQPVGQTSAAQVFTVQNTGNADLHMSSASTSGDFAISSDTCSGSTVAPNGMCTISVTFTPTQTGSRPGALTISDDAADSPQTVTLGGTGTRPALSLSASSLAFGGQAVGTTSVAQTVTVTNTGTADLHVSGVSTSGTNAGDFSASPSGCGTVAPAGTCTVSVTFTPSAPGGRSATLNIVSDAPSSPDQVSLSGTGLDSRLSLSPNPMNFGNVLLGQSSTLTLTFSNSGNDPTHLTGPPTSGGPNSGDFVPDFSTFTCPSDSAGPYIPAHGACSVNVTFTPGAAGARAATLTFPNDSSDGPQQLTLSGNGTNPGISVAPAALTFPSQGIGTTSPAQPVVVTSSGTSSLTVSSVTASGPFQVSTDGCSGTGPIAPAGMCTVQVVFKPTAMGPASGTLTITSDGGTKTVALSGSGVAVADLGISIGASPNPIKRSAKALLTYTVTLKNAGPSQASGIVISDPLPSFTQFRSLTPPAGGTCTTPAVGASGTLKCNLTALNAGASVQFQIVVKVVAPRSMTITNTVTETSQSVDPDPADNQASASTVVK
jgi:uncharacterized repeat protein (TIGR01451 family)